MKDSKSKGPWRTLTARSIAVRSIACQQGPQDPRSIQPEYPDSPSRPRGRREATDDRPQATVTNAFRTQALSLESQASQPQSTDDRVRAVFFFVPVACSLWPVASPHQGQDRNQTSPPPNYCPAVTKSDARRRSRRKIVRMWWGSLLWRCRWT